MRKNKKGVLISLAIVACLPVLTGCSNKTATTTNLQNTQNTPAQGSGQRNGRMPDFGQPDRQADVRGVVTTIVGNEVTVLKIAANQGRRASSTNETNASSSPRNQDAPSLSLGGNMEGRPAAGQAGPGGFAGGRPGGPDGGPGGGGTTDRAAMLASLKAMSTGQETIVIPVGIKMMKSENDATGKRTTVEASLADVTADKMITVWLNTSVTDKKIADFVLIN
ncbi:MAG: hypothetical protein WCN88_01965 [Candidatus Falkowbacteria bacterium]